MKFTNLIFQHNSDAWSLHVQCFTATKIISYAECNMIQLLAFNIFSLSLLTLAFHSRAGELQTVLF